MDNAVTRLAILGSTGSIGRQTLDIVRSLPGKFRVVALAAGKNLPLLTQQVAEFQPQFVFYEQINRKNKPDFNIPTLSLEEMACLPEADIVIVATSGIASLKATLLAAKNGKDIAIANKEPLVMAGELIIRAAEKHGASIFPIDSEHSAIWQCLTGEIAEPSKIILTASGGPFRTYTKTQLKNVTPEEALQHPSWQMGKKVTIDSATLMNKGLEVIEAHWLFGVPFEAIKVVVHPQSVIHSMVEFADGSVKAQLACPDMRLPIQYALSYPQRFPNNTLPRLDWDKIKEFTFDKPDMARFPCLRLAIEAGKAGGTMPTVLCAADEIAVDLFLKKRIGFMDIQALVAACLDKHEIITKLSLEVIYAADAWARDYALKLARKKKD